MLYENQHQTINIKNWPGLIRLREYLFTHTCRTAGLLRGNPPFHSSIGGDFVNSQFASYFHHIARFMTIKRLIKPLFIFNQQYLLFVIIAEAVIYSHFEQIWRLSPKSGDLTCMIYANGIMLPGWLEQWWCSGQVLACRARDPGFDSQSHHYISEIGYLLLPSHNLAETSPKRRKSSEQQTRLEYNRQIQRIQKIPISHDFCTLVECAYFERGMYHSFQLLYKL